VSDDTPVSTYHNWCSCFRTDMILGPLEHAAPFHTITRYWKR